MKGKFKIDFPGTVSRFESAIHKFQIKKIIYKTIFRGRGLEFETFRDFAPDDDSNMIDWKASLRANKLLAKQYIEERDLNVYFFVDVSSSMLFGSKDKLKAEYAAEVVAALSYLIINSGDKVGLILYSDKVVKFLHPSRDTNHFSILTMTLSDTKFYGGGFNFEKIVEYALKRINTSYSLIVWVSDFIRVRGNYLNHLSLLSSKFETIALMIRDPFDDELPNVKTQITIQDPYSNRQMTVDPSLVYEKYKVGVKKHKEKLYEVFKKSNIDFLELNTSKDFVIPLVSFLKARAGDER